MRQNKWTKKWYGLAMSTALIVGTGCGDGCGGNNQDSPECTTNADCASSEVCSPEQQCEPRGGGDSCERDVDCVFSDYCAEGVCTPNACEDDDDCATGAICTGETCGAGCREDDQCEGDLVCNELSDECEPAGCLSTGCEPNIETCDESGEVPRCIPTGSCANDGQCAIFAAFQDNGLEYLCDVNQQECVEKPQCESFNDCPIGDICEIRSDQGERNRCRPGCSLEDANNDGAPDVPCATGEFCDVNGDFAMQQGSPFANNFCVQGCLGDGDSNNCSELLNDADGDYACIDLLCIETCNSFDDCSDGLICTGQPSICQGCINDSQCAATQFCDLTRGRNDEEEADDSIGLCTDLPPACTPDGYGENTSLDSAFRVESFPFVADGTIADVSQPFFCNENNNAGEWFVVTAEPGKVITVTIDYEVMGANLDLALKDSVGADLLTSARPPTVDQGSESLSYGVEVAGDYIIQVRGGVSADALPYMLTIDVADPPACVDDMFEENDMLASPALLAADTDYESLQVCGTDRDFYRLDVLSNQVVRVETVGAVRDGDIDLFVTTLDGTPVESATTQSDDEVVFFATEGATSYVVEVAVASGVGNIDYDLRWSQRPNECSDLYDTGAANDTCGTASELPFMPVVGSMPEVNAYSSATDLGEEMRICSDEDWYKITLLPLQEITVSAVYDARQSAGFIDVRLRGPEDCNVIAAFDDRTRDESDRNIVTQSFSYTASSGGDFYVVVNRSQGINVLYDLNIEITDGPPCPEDEYDTNGASNDDLASAVSIDRAQALLGTENAYVGLRYCDLNEDFYSIELEAGDEIQWIVSHTASPGRDLDATIFYPAGANPMSVSSTSTDDDEIISAVAPIDGTYTLRVYGKTPTRMDYRLLTYIKPSGAMDFVGPLDPDCPDDFENNDDSTEATAIAPGTYGLLVCGQTGPTNNALDDDWFKVDLEPGERLDVRLDFLHSSGNIDLFFYEESSFSRPLLRSQTANDFEELTFTAQREQTIYFKVNTFRSVESNAYNLTVNVTPAPACADDALEENDDVASAAMVDSPGFNDRLLKCEDDDDWYTFEVTENQRVEVYANFVSDADIDLFIYSDAAGTVLIEEGISTEDDNESVDFIAADDPATSAADTQTVYTYYVRVDTKSRARLGYDLLVYRDLDGDGMFGEGEGNPDRDCPDRFEDNDSRNSPTSLSSGSYDDLRICWRGGSANDADYYSVFVPAGASLTADLTFSHDDGNLQLAILRTNGSQVTNSLSSDDNESATADNTSSTGVTYLVHVYGSGTDFENYYDLELTLDFQGSMCDEDTFGAPSLADATSTTAVGQYEGLFLCENTEDWFAISASANDRVLAEFELDNTFGNIDVQLTDNSGTVLATSTNDATSPGGGDRETIDHVVSSAGTYYIRVLSRNGAFIRNAYDMWLSVGGVTPAEPFCPDGYERNDDRLSATTLNINGSKIYTDMIACGAEQDWYRISGLQGGTYDVIAFYDADADSNIDLEVVDSNGMSLSTGTSTDNDESLSFTISPGQTYFIKAENVASPGGETPYTLYVNRQGQASCQEDTYEQNDTPAQSLSVPVIDTLGTYTLGSCGDDDYFRIEAAQSGPLTLTVKHDATALPLLTEARNLANNAFGTLDSSQPNRQVISFGSVNAGDIIRLYIGTADVSNNGIYLLEYEQ